LCYTQATEVVRPMNHTMGIW